MVSPVLLIVAPLGAAFLSVLVGRIAPARGIALVTVGALVAFVPQWLQAVLVQPVRLTIADATPPVGIGLSADALSMVLIVLVLVSAVLVVLYSFSYMPHVGNQEHRYYAVLLLLLAGGFGMLLTRDIFNLFVFYEILCISSYILVAYGQDDFSLEASIKYLILGSLGSVFMLVAIGLSYRVAGSLAMADVAAALAAAPTGYGVTVSVLFIVGMGIEAAIFPLNAWLPDAHSSAPSSVSAVLSGFVIEVALVVLLRLTVTVFTAPVAPLLAVLALAGVVVGELAALGQTELKRALAYSSIGQVGILLFAFTLGTAAGTQAGLAHLVMHAGAKSALFLIAGYFIVRTGGRNIADYYGLAKRMPVASTLFVLAALSLIGVPPLFGFFTKFRVLTAAAAVGSAVAWTGIGIILAATVVESVYLFRVVRVLFTPSEEAAGHDGTQIARVSGAGAASAGLQTGAASAESQTGGTAPQTAGRADLPVLPMIAVLGFVAIVLAGGFLLPVLDTVLAPAAMLLAAL